MSANDDQAIAALAEYIYDESAIENYYPAKCYECGWCGVSSECSGGGQIADTGDYDDVYCPKCERPRIDENEDAWVLAHDVYKALMALHAKVQESEKEVKSLRGFKRGVDEALNSGDGVYRP